MIPCINRTLHFTFSQPHLHILDYLLQIPMDNIYSLLDTWLWHLFVSGSLSSFVTIAWCQDPLSSLIIDQDQVHHFFLLGVSNQVIICHHLGFWSPFLILFVAVIMVIPLGTIQPLEIYCLRLGGNTCTCPSPF